MKSHLVRFIILAFLGISTTAAFSQTQYTPYDDIPGIIKSYKPAFEPGYPEWAGMLYQYPVNFHQLIRAYHTSDTVDHIKFRAIDRYYKIWKRMVEPWVLDDGTIFLSDPGQYYTRLNASQVASYKKKKPASELLSNWTFLGPKETFWLNESGSSQAPKACPWQVNVYSFDVSASDNNILYCGTETGFVNKSSDQGMTWQILASAYYFGGAVTATAVHPLNSDIVYVAAGNQIHKTTDGGTNWTPMLQTGNLFYADRLRIDPSNPEKILAASNTGLYISNNGGQNWIKPWANPSYDVEISQQNNNIIFALTSINGKFAVTESVDGGLTFSPMPFFPGNISDVSGGLLAVTPADPQMILAVLLSSDNLPFLFKCNTLTGNWTLLATGQSGQFPMDNGQGYFDLVLEISPVNPNLIFAGTTTLYKSSNGGQSFTAVGGYAGAFAIHPDIQDMKLLPNGDTWVSTDGGLTLTTDNFSSTNNYFARNLGLTGSDMWGFDQGWNEDIVVGGRYHNGNTAMADFYQPKALRMGGAESPTGWVLQGKSRHVAFNDLGNGWILPSEAEGEPEGRFIFSKYPNMEEYGGRRGNMVLHPNYYGTVYLGEGQGFWKSTDMGLTYDLLHDFNATVMYLQISNKNPDVIYADVAGLGLHLSDDAGQSWVLKPSLTSGQYGTSYWKGKLFFAISPYNENVIYACLQNGTWSADIGKVFRSDDGGDTWTDWTGSVTEYLKCMVIQPSSGDQDLVYLFTNARNGQPARVFVRGEGMNEWEPFENNYPAGMSVNMALPFFRDGKLRVAGNAGVWESPMAEPEFIPVINPWVEKSFYNCMTDTLMFDDHSILNHEGAAWHWEINPEPQYLENPDIRNPKVVLGTPGTYNVSVTVMKNGETYNKDMPGMVSTTTCPSIEDCNNPAVVPKNIWELLYVDSEEINDPGLATMSFDDDPSTIWHTRWSTGDDPYPHEIRVDMGTVYKIYKFIYLPRQDGTNGRILDYELYISLDTNNWGSPVSTGQFENTAAPQSISFDDPPIGRYWRLVALSEVNANPWASAAEFSLVGCTSFTGVPQQTITSGPLNSFPVPTSGTVTVPIPDGNNFRYVILSSSGQIVEQGIIHDPGLSYPFDLCKYNPGIYTIRLTSENGQIYRIKTIMN